jgi:hypothetical protein
MPKSTRPERENSGNKNRQEVAHLKADDTAIPTGTEEIGKKKTVSARDPVEDFGNAPVSEQNPFVGSVRF